MIAPLNRRQLLAGALAAGSAPALLRRAHATEVPRFTLGVASGRPSEQGLVLWTRLTGPDLPPRVTVQWELAHDEAFTRIAARGQEIAPAEWAHSVHAEPRGLAPSREYWYRFTALGQRSAAGRTRTAPARDAALARLHCAVTSCQRWDQGHYAAWADVAASDLDLVFFVGDYIYEAASPRAALRAHRGGRLRTLAQYRERYAQYKSDPLLQAAHAACPWLVVWDDHEVENDYANLHSERDSADFAVMRAAAYQAWWEHMPVSQAMRPVGPDARIYQRLDWGLLARIQLLDTRQYRDVQACPAPGRGASTVVRLKDCPELTDSRRSLLGAAQEAWLAEGWSPTHRWNLLAQQTLMARFNREHPAVGGGRYWTDAWDGYPAARRRLLDTLAARRVSGAVVLGGDIHANVVADLRADFDDPRSPVLASEFCGTSISSQGAPQSVFDAARALNPHLHHARSDQRGWLRLALDARMLTAELRVVDDVRDAGSALQTAARFSVQAQRPGVQPG